MIVIQECYGQTTFISQKVTHFFETFKSIPIIFQNFYKNFFDADQEATQNERKLNSL